MNWIKKELIQLIKARGAIAQEITDYNFRSYFVRRANEDVEALEKDDKTEVTAEMVAEAQKSVKQMERIKVVQNSIYIV